MFCYQNELILLKSINAFCSYKYIEGCVLVATLLSKIIHITKLSIAPEIVGAVMMYTNSAIAYKIESKYNLG